MTGLQSEVAGVPFFLLDEGALENIKGHTEVIGLFAVCFSCFVDGLIDLVRC